MSVIHWSILPEFLAHFYIPKCSSVQYHLALISFNVNMLYAGHEPAFCVTYRLHTLQTILLDVSCSQRKTLYMNGDILCRMEDGLPYEPNNNRASPAKPLLPLKVIEI